MLGVVTIDYKNSQMTIDFVNKELLKIDVPYVCVIVVNACTEEELRLIQNSTKARLVSEGECNEGNIFILPSSENLGFAKGNNLGADFLVKLFDIDYLLFSNTDVEIKSKQNISRMIARMNEDPRIGAIGPKVVSLDGSLQFPHEGFISPYRQIGWHLFPFLRRKNMQRDNSAALDEPEECFCYWVQGSFFVMATKLFLSIGMFDPHTFLYAEEPILAEKLMHVGKRMFYYPEVTILHYEGGTILKENTNYRSLYMAMESNCYYYRKYLNYSPMIVWLYKWSFVINHKIFKK